MNLRKFLILFCAVFLLFKTFCSETLFHTSTYGMPALIEKGHVDQLFIGSSMFRQGIDIQTLNSEFPEKENYILAYNGNQPIWEYYQLKNLLDNGVTIDTVYLDMYIYSMIAPPKINDEKMFLEFDFRNKKDIFSNIKNTLTLTDKWSIWIESCNEILIFWSIYKYIIDSQFENGGTKIGNEGVSKEVLDKLEIPNLSAEIDPIQWAYLKKIVEMANENNIKLIFLETPKYSKVSEDYEYKKKMTAYRRIAEELGVGELKMKNTFNCEDAANYIDLIHLSEDGRKKFTDNVCSIIHEFGE